MERYPDEDEGDVGAWEDPDESDMDDEDDDGPSLVACPYCQREISEDAEICPKCGSYISGEDAPRRRMPTLIIIGVALMALVLIAWAMMRG
jgi:predicted nucleic acid-binding Zn ribbon protein